MTFKNLCRQNSISSLLTKSSSENVNYYRLVNIIRMATTYVTFLILFFSSAKTVSGLQNGKIQEKSKTSLQFSRWERFSVFRVLINHLKSSQIISNHLKSSQINQILLHHHNTETTIYLSFKTTIFLIWMFHISSSEHLKWQKQIKTQNFMDVTLSLYNFFTLIWTQLLRSTFHKIVNESEATLKKKSKSSREDRRRISLFKKPICNMLVVTKGC